MKTNITHSLIRMGIAGSIISIIWWTIYFDQVLSKTNVGLDGLFARKGLLHYVDCLFMSTEVCAAVYKKSLPTFYQYQPGVLWVSILLLSVGCFVLISQPIKK